jgi:hypothetical protein
LLLSVGLVAPLVLLAPACHKPVETSANHVLHRGETGRLWSPSGGVIWLSTQKERSPDVVKAAASDASIRQMAASGLAFSVEVGTPVQVLSESYNERQVEILAGPLKGRTGWVPWEALKPPAPERP